METTTIQPTSMRTQDFRALLQEELIARCRKNSSYSLRAYAKSLGVSHSALAEMLSGKRVISKKSMEKFGVTLGLGMHEIIDYQNSPQSREDEKKQIQASYQQLTLDQFAIISDWYHYAILELIKIKNFPHSPSNFSKALGITRSEANIAVERLIRIGILETNAEGKLHEVSAGFTTNISGNLTSLGSKKLQKQILEQSIEALMTLPTEVRNHTSMTMAINPKHMPEAIEMIRKFRRELTDFLEAQGESSEVYQMSISLFPITQIKDNFNSGENV